MDIAVSLVCFLLSLVFCAVLLFPYFGPQSSAKETSGVQPGDSDLDIVRAKRERAMRALEDLERELAVGKLAQSEYEMTHSELLTEVHGYDLQLAKVREQTSRTEADRSGQAERKAAKSQAEDDSKAVSKDAD